MDEGTAGGNPQPVLHEIANLCISLTADVITRKGIEISIL
jgi:hypothetical protein